MNVEAINECINLSLQGKITFPEVVERLAKIGVERYLVDLVSSNKITYDNQGDYHMASHPFPKMSIIPQDFNSESIKNSIQDIQQKKINYVEFLKQILQAGCCHYEVYINGKIVIYCGRNGSMHIEEFPK